MRKTASIKIGDKEVVLKELRVKDIIFMTEKFPEMNFSVDGIQEIAKELLPRFTSDMTGDDLLEMTGSEINAFWEKFKEINTDFFGMAEKFGLTKLLSDLKEAVMNDFSNLYAGLLQEGTENAPGITDTPSS